MDPDSYKQLFYGCPVPIYVFDEKSFDFYAVNDAAVEQYGYTESEFLTMKATDIRPEEEIAAFKQANTNVPEEYVDLGRWRHRKKNGQIFYVHIYGHTAEFEGKKVRIILAVDVDKKVRIESELKNKDAEITNILESITDGFYALNRKWEVVYFNKTAEKILGCKREEVIGKNLWEFFPNALEGRFYSKYSEVMQEGVSTQFEEYYTPLELWSSIHVYPTQDGVAVYFMDITEQKQIQERIYRDEENLRAIINNTSDLIWSIDTQYNFISANDAFWKRLEFKTGRRVEKLFGGGFNNETVNEWSVYYERSFTGEAFKIIRSQKIEGQLIFEEVSFNPIFDKTGRVAGVSCFARDITKQYLHTQMIERQNEQLKEIARMLSHDLRAPVARILGLVPLFNKQNTADPVNTQLLSYIEEATTSMDEIVKRINEHTITIKDIETDFDRDSSDN
jgi:PAS domain S-box-containing protein